jgi:hypothetical protein
MRPMGRFAVPSALAIGSVVPDLWYFVPTLDRSDTHVGGALFWFCPPVGLAAYLLFHLLLKQPLIALVSPRLAGFTPRSLPAVPWHAVIVSLLVGAATHMVWDGLTHFDSPKWPQHASTLAGSAILALWLWRKLRHAPPAPALLRPLARLCVAVLLAGVMAVCALWAADVAPAFDLVTLRTLLRTAGLAAVQGLGVALFIYCLAFRRKMA